MSTSMDNIADNGPHTTASLLGVLGVSESESSVFDALLNCPHGISVVEMSRVLNIPRPTIYARLERLIAKGLVRRGLEESGSVYSPETPEIISDIYKKAAMEIEEKRLQLDQYIEQKNPEFFYRPKFSLIKNSESAETIFREVLRSRVKSISIFWPVREMEKVVSSEIFSFWFSERLARNMYIQVLWPSQQKVPLARVDAHAPRNIEDLKREIRILPRGIQSHLAYFIYGNKISFLSSQKEGYAFTLDSKDMVELHQSQFDFLWTQSAPYTEK
jgi:sugar-specific transcriptional regulator TrmB